MTNLFIVESPGKIAKISAILGKDYIVKASKGHIRDLDPHTMSIDFENHYEPIYVITRPDVVRELRRAMRGVKMVYLASDQDYEGAQIAQSLYEVLRPRQYLRVTYNSITREEIMRGIKEAGPIDKRLVDAQKARRVVDRLFGYLISSLLQKKIGGNLSAGRVQSPALRLVVEKEDEMRRFMEEETQNSWFRVWGTFSEDALVATLYSGNSPANLADESGTQKILELLLDSHFEVYDVKSKVELKHASPPFITATLQQEANRRLGLSVETTMMLAQKLYEAGHITYMRTDSPHIASEAQEAIRRVILEKYGEEYYHKQIHQVRSASAQLAHEAIRPVHPDVVHPEIDDVLQLKLYQLIWRRTIASQMAPARINVLSIWIGSDKYPDKEYYFLARQEQLLFPGFTRIYGTDVHKDKDGDSVSSKTYRIGKSMELHEIRAEQEYKSPPACYGQASLVKKLEKLGIGRPSTYVTIIKTILMRDYVRMGDLPGVEKEAIILWANTQNREIVRETHMVRLGEQRNRILPTELGRTVNEFLIRYFADLIDYQFTANLEKELDEIAEGHKVWYHVVDQFYKLLDPRVTEVSRLKTLSQETQRLLGKDAQGKPVYVLRTKYGPAVKKRVGKKWVYAKLGKLDPQKITLKEALQLLEYPKVLGQFEGKDILLKKGSYGFYLNYQGENYSLENEKITLQEAIQKIREARKRIIKQLAPNILVLQGPYGPYVQVKRRKVRKNYGLPQNVKPENLTLEDLEKILKQRPRRFSRKRTNGPDVG